MAKKEGLVAKTKRRMKELWYGERTYTKGRKAPEKQTKMRKTARTVQTVRGLRAAGLSEKDIAKFMPKRKK